MKHESDAPPVAVRPIHMMQTAPLAAVPEEVKTAPIIEPVARAATPITPPPDNLVLAPPPAMAGADATEPVGAPPGMEIPPSEADNTEPVAGTPGVIHGETSSDASDAPRLQIVPVPVVGRAATPTSVHSMPTQPLKSLEEEAGPTMMTGRRSSTERLASIKPAKRRSPMITIVAVVAAALVGAAMYYIVG